MAKEFEVKVSRKTARDSIDWIRIDINDVEPKALKKLEDVLQFLDDLDAALDEAQGAASDEDQKVVITVKEGSQF